MSHTLSELTSLVDGDLIGHPDINITQVATSQHADEGKITFISEPKYLSYLKSCSASAVIVNDKHASSVPEGMSILVHNNPYWAFARISQILNPPQRSFEGVHSSACVDESVVIGSNVHIGPNVSIEPHCVIGNNVTIKAVCVIEHNVNIGANS